jgi:lysophospholipase
MFIKKIEERFLEPAGWRWRKFERGGRTLRFGAMESPTATAAVICLPGLGEFAEKYFETARDCAAMNLSFYIMDWMGQGKSDRFLKNPLKRHSTGFENDINDLDFFIKNHVPKNIPLVMLAHSMGGNIGMRYLMRPPHTFACAAFSAPMFGIKAVAGFETAARVLATFMNTIAGQSYVPGGGDNPPENRSKIHGPDDFSSDPVRAAVHNAWREIDPSLRVGGVTFGWIYHALKSCAAIKKTGALENIKIPCAFYAAGDEHLVDNTAIRDAAARIKNAKFIELKDARHEILMERDDIRKQFFNAFKSTIKEIIPTGS